MSPQKNCKLKSILITLQTTFWSIREVFIEHWCNFKYYYSWIYPKTNFVLQFFYILVSFRVFLPWATLSHFLRKYGLWLFKNGMSVKTYATVSTSNFLIQPLLTTVDSFLYVHIRFRIFRVVIWTNWNNYYNITNVPTTLHLN